MSFMWNYFFGGVAHQLKGDLVKLHEKNLTSTERRAEAAVLIKKALQKVKEKRPTAFQEARRSGSGCFIEILKASVDAKFGEKMLFQKDINTVKGLRKTEDGYPQKKSQRKSDGLEVTENLVSCEEFAGFFVQWMALYSETFDKLDITSMDDAVSIIGASGIHVSARWIVRTFVWDVFKEGLFGDPQEGDYNEAHIKWLLEKSIEVIDNRCTAGFKLPGKDKNDDESQTNLSNSIATNHNLSSTCKNLSKTNVILLVDKVKKEEEIAHLKKENESLKKEKAAEMPKKAKANVAGSSNKNTMTVTPASIKKKAPIKKDHDFIDDEKVTIKNNYQTKDGYAGKKGKVKSSTKVMVVVGFEDGTTEDVTLSHKFLKHS